MSNLELEEASSATERSRTTALVDGYGRETNQGSTWRRPTSFVFFVIAEGVGHIHIATTCDVNRRYRELQAASPCRLEVIKAVAGGADKEATIHEEFADERLWGKWFRGSEALREFVRDLPAEPY